MERRDQPRCDGQCDGGGLVHKGEYVLNQQDLFDLHHDNLFPRGTRLAPGGGIYRPAGIPLDNFGPMRIPTQENWLPAWSPGDASRQAAAHERSLPAWSPGRGTTTAPWSPRGTSFGEAASNAAGNGLRPGLQTGWTAARGFLSDPKNWAGLGANLAHGAAGAGVTTGLNWAGGKLNSALRNSDTYGGAAFGLFSDAAGGAVAGARGGPLGAGIGAVSDMVIGDAARIYGNLRDIHRATVGDDKTHQQVDAAQQALLQRQRQRVDARVTESPHPSAAAQAFDARFQGQGDHISASEAQQAKTEELLARLNKQREGWTAKPNQPLPANINPATGQRWGQSDGERRRSHPDSAGSGYWNQAEPRRGNGAEPRPANATNGMPPPPGMPPAPAGPSEGPRSGGGGNTQEANGCLELSCKLLGEFNTGLANATEALERFTAGLSAPPRAAGGAPSVPGGSGGVSVIRQVIRKHLQFLGARIKLTSMNGLQLFNWPKYRSQYTNRRIVY